MSISNNPKIPEEITRERLLKESSIKKIFKKSATIINSESTYFLLLTIILITGIGECFGIIFNWKWYLLVLAVLIIFAIDKFKN